MSDAIVAQPLSEFVDRVVGGGTPPRAVSAYWSGPIPWASVKDLSESSLTLTDTEEHISPSGLANSAASLVRAGTPIVCTRMAVGRCAIPVIDVAINQDLKALIPSTGVDARYLAYGVDFLRYSLESVSTGSTVKGLSLRELLSFRLYKPSLTEQKSIAYILDMADEAIRSTERIIAKLEQAKHGLMFDLLGKNPDSLPLSAIGEIASTYAGGTPSRAIPAFYGGGIPWVKSGEVNQRSITTTEETITQEALRFSSARWVPAGVPIVAMYGATAGAVSWTQIQVTTNQAVLAVLPHVEGIQGRWLYWTLLQASLRILASIQGSGQPNLSKRIIDNFRLYIPPPDEQSRAAAVLDVHQSVLDRNRVMLRKLRAEKQGLTSDLLTGRVRIPPEAVP